MPMTVCTSSILALILVKISAGPLLLVLKASCLRWGSAGRLLWIPSKHVLLPVRGAKAKSCLFLADGSGYNVSVACW